MGGGKFNLRSTTFRFFFVLTILCFPLAALAADLSIKPGDQVVRIDVQTEAQLKLVLDLDLDLWSHEFDVGPIEAHVSEIERKALEAAGLTWEVLNADLYATYRAERSALLVRGGGPFDNYMPLADMIQFINQLAANRPDLCQVIDIGNSLEERDIWVLRITGPAGGGGPDPGDRPGVFYHGLQHAREWITGPTVLYLADYLVNRYDSDPCVRELVDRTEFYLAPCVNPDGYEYTWTTQRLWRKNRRDNGNGSFGVDLNRNWGFQWGFDNSGSSPTPSSEIYRGTAPFSEPETRVLRDFILARPNIRAYMDYHCYSQLILWPWGYTPALSPDQSLFNTLGTTMRQLIQSVHGLSYTAGPINTTIYPANGGSVDWVYGAAGIVAYTIELRDTGQFGFILPADQIIPNCEENLPAILHLSRWASLGLLIELPQGVPAVIAAGQPTAIQVQITPAQETYSPGSGRCYYRYSGSGPFDDVPLTSLGGNLYSATIPEAPCGVPVEFYFTANGDGGYVAKSPCDAPANVHRSFAIDQEDFYTNEFEGSLAGWTVGDVGDNATIGIWGAMDPQGTAAQPEDDHTPAPGVICFVTDGRAGTSIGSYDVDNGKTTLKSPVFDLTAMDDPIVSYWRWYSNDQGAAPNTDVFVVDISPNAGGNWVNVETLGPAGPQTSGGWYYYEFRVSDLIPLTSQIQLRFVASDDAPGSIVEAALDDFAIRDLGCNCPIPGDMNGDGNVDGLDIAEFVHVLTTDPYYHPCADLAEPQDEFTVDLADMVAFIELLLGGP